MSDTPENNEAPAASVVDDFDALYLRDSRLTAELLPVVEAVLAEGYRVFTPHSRRPINSDRTHVFACKALDGPFALIGQSDNSTAPPSVIAPVAPEHGYGVYRDSDGSIGAIIRVLGEVCASPTVGLPFTAAPAQVVPNHGYAAMAAWTKGDDIIEIIKN